MATVSVDLDSLHHYCRIHGLPESALPDEARSLVYRLAVPRFLELWAEKGISGTFFVIGEDAECEWAQEPLRAAVRAGVELGNHSHTHLYDLSRLSPEAIDAELAKAEVAIEQVAGKPPSGFRAPGYTLSSTLYQGLEARGYLYDSSTFPATPYYLAKGAVMTGLALLGRGSAAVLDSPRVLSAPRVPYRPERSDPYRSGAGKTLELPIAVAPWTRVPFYGTFAAAMPRWLVRQVYRSAASLPVFNFELHGVDLLDVDDGIPSALARQQRDLRVPWRQKRQRLGEVFEWLNGDFELLTLETVARRLNDPASG
jgi:peptidoglycan/xylan/chitin deacetylase (PgdA/CDA1 family)